EIDALVTVDTATSTAAGWTCEVNSLTGTTTCKLPISVGLNGGNSEASAMSKTLQGTVADSLGNGVSQTTATFSIFDDIDDQSTLETEVADGSSDVIISIAAAPDLVVSTTADKTTVTPGEQVSFTFDVNNTGSQIATGVEIHTTIPVNTTFDAGPSSGLWSCCPAGTQPCAESDEVTTANAACVYSVGSLSVGAALSDPPKFVVTIDSTVASNVGTIESTVSVLDDGLNGDDAVPADNTVMSELTLDAAPAFTVTLTEDNTSQQPGGTILYTISVVNTGNQDAENVDVSVVIPTGTTHVPESSSTDWNCVTVGSDTTCTFTHATIAAGVAASDIVLALLIDSPLASGITQVVTTANVADNGTNTGNVPVTASSNESVITLDASPGLNLTFSATQSSVTPGGAATYTVNIVNTGNQNATGVTVAVQVPTDTEFDTNASNALLSTDSWTCDDSSDPKLCTLSIGEVPADGLTTETRTFILETATRSTAPSGDATDGFNVNVVLDQDDADAVTYSNSETTYIARCGYEYRFETSDQYVNQDAQDTIFQYVSGGNFNGTGYWRTGADDKLTDTSTAKLTHLNMNLDIPAISEGGEKPVVEILYVLQGESDPDKDRFGVCIGTPDDTGSANYKCNATSAEPDMVRKYLTGDNTPLDSTLNNDGVTAFTETLGTDDVDRVIIDVTDKAGQTLELSMFYQTTGSNDEFQGLTILEVLQYSDADNDDALDGSAALCDLCWDKDGDGYAFDESPGVLNAVAYEVTPECAELADCNDDTATLKTEADCVEDCSDGVDNNEDGLIDCDDSACASSTSCNSCAEIFTFDTGAGGWTAGGESNGNFGLRIDTEPTGWVMTNPDISTAFSAFVSRSLTVDSTQPVPKLYVKLR
ncbi:MAG: hypothetical protein VX223_06855, partial [Myxococcota bacterium]|nr:hypothetical protein [Myxococcota bacterium]